MMYYTDINIIPLFLTSFFQLERVYIIRQINFIDVITKGSQNEQKQGQGSYGQYCSMQRFR